MDGKNFSGRVIAENLMRKFQSVLSYDDPYLIYLFVNNLIRRHYSENLGDGLTNIWLFYNFLTEFWLNWKNSFGEVTLFLKRFDFCINFINFLTNICVDQVVLKLQVLKPEKIRDRHYNKTSDQEINSWSMKYLELTIKGKSWYIHDFFKPGTNNASSSSPFNAAAIAHINILIVWYFYIFFNKYFRF